MVRCKQRLERQMTKEKKLDIEQLIEKLEAISEQLQSGNLSLNESIELYKEGIEVAKLLDKELAKVDSDIEVLKEQLTNINLNEESE
ncbi:MAG: exodeoxyribonuclease VII small subunit [Dehalococcoidaceae bacterium]|nr:exodeoxyribonuclease VII small subunit [Dehalococcoidaceae bacterium]